MASTAAASTPVGLEEQSPPTFSKFGFGQTFGYLEGCCAVGPIGHSCCHKIGYFYSNTPKIGDGRGLKERKSEDKREKERERERERERNER